MSNALKNLMHSLLYDISINSVNHQLACHTDSASYQRAIDKLISDDFIEYTVIESHRQNVNNYTVIGLTKLGSAYFDFMQL